MLRSKLFKNIFNFKPTKENFEISEMDKLNQNQFDYIQKYFLQHEGGTVKKQKQ